MPNPRVWHSSVILRPEIKQTMRISREIYEGCQTPRRMPTPKDAKRLGTLRAEPGEGFLIVLEPLPDGVPAERRLARLLKCCLRTFRLKCTYVGPASARTETPAEKDR